MAEERLPRVLRVGARGPRRRAVPPGAALPDPAHVRGRARRACVPFARSGANPFQPGEVVAAPPRTRSRSCSAATRNSSPRSDVTMSARCRRSSPRTTRATSSPSGAPGAATSACCRRIYRALGADRPAAPRDRLRLRHRLLEPHPRLHDRLRLQQRARPRPAHRAGHQARATRTCWCWWPGGDGDGFSIGGGHVRPRRSGATSTSRTS